MAKYIQRPEISIFFHTDSIKYYQEYVGSRLLNSTNTDNLRLYIPPPPKDSKPV